MNIYQIGAICGMLSPIVYTAMWILGGILQSDYSHIQDDISLLFAVDAPNQRLYQSFMIIETVLLFVFVLILHEGLNDGGGSPVGPVLFILSATLGILIVLFFPLDAGGELITFRGKMHLALVVLMGIFQIVGMVALWLRLQSVAEWSVFATYSLITAAISLILVIFAGVYATSNYKGLIERLMVSPYQLYSFVLGLMIFLHN